MNTPEHVKFPLDPFIKYFSELSEICWKGIVCIILHLVVKTPVIIMYETVLPGKTCQGNAVYKEPGVYTHEDDGEYMH